MGQACWPPESVSELFWGEPFEEILQKLLIYVLEVGVLVGGLGDDGEGVGDAVNRSQVPDVEEGVEKVLNQGHKQFLV